MGIAPRILGGTLGTIRFRRQRRHDWKCAMPLPRSQVSELFAALDINGGLVVMFKAYLDESYDSKILVISAWAADAVIWPDVEAQWARQIQRVGVSEYHAVDCAHGVEEFKGWPKEKRNLLTKKLTRIITHRRPLHPTIRKGMYGISVALLLDDYRELMTGAAGEEFPDPYMLALQLIVRRIAYQASRLPEGEQVECIFDQNEEFAGNATDLFTRIVRSPLVPHREKLRGIAFESSKKFIPLQAADLLAFETLLAVRRKLSPGGRERELRRSLKAMFAMPLNGFVIGSEYLTNLLKHHGLMALAIRRSAPPYL